MSLEQLAQEIEKANPEQNASSATLYAHATHELLYSTSEREKINKKGEIVKETFFDVDAKTEIVSPSSFSALESLSKFFGKEFLSTESDEDIDYFLLRTKINMISKDRQSRKEITSILTANALSQNNQSNPVKLGQL